MIQWYRGLESSVFGNDLVCWIDVCMKENLVVDGAMKVPNASKGGFVLLCEDNDHVADGVAAGLETDMV